MDDEFDVFDFEDEVGFDEELKLGFDFFGLDDDLVYDLDLDQDVGKKEKFVFFDDEDEDDDEREEKFIVVNIEGLLRKLD